MTKPADVDVLVVGAGPAGLTLAVDLKRRGVTVRLIEQRSEPVVASRGKGVQPRTLEILDNLGALDRFLAVSGTYPIIRLMRGAEVEGERPFAVQIEPTSSLPYPNLLMAGQWRTDGVLRDTLRDLGGEVDYGVTLLSFKQDGEGVDATLTRGGVPITCRARYLVATDGGRSPVRTRLEIGFPGSALDGPRILFGDVLVDHLERDAWWMWPGDKGVVGLCPLPHSDFFQLMIPLPPDEEPQLAEAAVQALFRRRTGRDDLRLYSPQWLSIFTPSLRLADHYRVGRVFLAGDAAHVHPPTGGQGLNTSVQDAFNLGWKLGLVVRGQAPEALLDTYEAERRPVGLGVLSLSVEIARQGGGLSGQPRDRRTQQLDLNYRDSTLSQGSAEDTIVLPGDRAPDAPLDGAPGEPGRLFERFRGGHFCLLRFGAIDVETPAVAGIEIIQVPLSLEGDAALIYGVCKPTAILVRPDGYVGLIAIVAASATLARYLQFELDGADRRAVGPA